MNLVLDLMLRVLSHVMPWGLRWYYSPSTLAKMIRVTINSENDGLVVNCAGIPDARVWFEVTNQSPFPMEIQAMAVDLIWGAKVGQFVSIERKRINSHSYERLLVETVLTKEQANYIKEHHTENTPRLVVLIEFNCRIQAFALFGREITTTNHRVVNASVA